MPPKLGERESVRRTLCTHHLQVREKWGGGLIHRHLDCVSTRDMYTRPVCCCQIESQVVAKQPLPKVWWGWLLSNCRVLPHICCFSNCGRTVLQLGPQYLSILIKLTLPQFLQWCLLLLQENLSWQEKQLGEVPSGTQLGRSISKRLRWFGYYVHVSCSLWSRWVNATIKSELNYRTELKENAVCVEITILILSGLVLSTLQQIRLQTENTESKS